MSGVASSVSLTPQDVERASQRDAKRYELIEGELREKVMGFKALFIAARIAAMLNDHFYPGVGVAAVEVMIFCFDRPHHGRKPDVVYVKMERLPDCQVPDGDLHMAPDLVVEVLSPGNTGMELEDKLDEYLAAGVSMVWIVNPERRTIRVYRIDGTTQLFRADDIIENEPVLPGFKMRTGDVFPVPMPAS